MAIMETYPFKTSDHLQYQKFYDSRFDHLAYGESLIHHIVLMLISINQHQQFIFYNYISLKSDRRSQKIKNCFIIPKFIYS